MLRLDAPKIYKCGKHCEKGGIACNKQFLLFSQCFPPSMALIFHFKCTLKCHLQFVSIWTSLKFCNGLIGYILWKGTKLKAFAKVKIKVSKMMIFVLNRFENMGKRENAGYQHFLLFSSLPAKRKGTLGLHSVCQSIHQSVRLSVCLSIRPQYQISGLFS